MPRESNPLDVDGFAALSEGVDSGRSPHVLGRSQLAWLVNGTTRGGFPGCRPCWRRRTLRYMDETGAADATVQADFESNGLWQGAGSYLHNNGSGALVASIGGHIFRLRLSDYSVVDLTEQAGADYNNPKRPLSWFTQAENYMVIQNDHERAFIFDGASLARSNSPAHGGTGVPIGSVMAYIKGRLWVATDEGRAFVAGDLVYSLTGTSADVLSFTENTFLNGGGSFSIPSQAGRIRAMAGVAAQDSATGQASLQVFTEKGAAGVDAPFDRTLWQNMTSPILTISLLPTGAVAQASTINVNGDIWFRSPDGIRSFVIARRDHGTWVNTPLSREAERGLGFDTPLLLDYASGVLIDNRLLVTVGPSLAYTAPADPATRTLRGVVHRGLVVLDFAPTSQMFNRGQPVWDGLWTGHRLLQVLTAEHMGQIRCFAFVLSSADKIELWELDPGLTYDFNGATRTPVEWSFETPTYPFADGGWSLKKLAYADFWLNRIAGAVTVDTWFRPDFDPIWRVWKSGMDVCGPVALCADTLLPACSGAARAVPTIRQQQYRPRIRLPEPTSACDTPTAKPTDLGYRFAARFVVTGYAQVTQLRLNARPESEPADGACHVDEVCASVTPIASCGINDYTYVI